MSTYIIAIFSHMDGDNRLFEVEADTAVEAAKKAVINHADEKYRNEDYLNWANGLGETYEDGQDNATQSELIISTFYKS